MGRIMRIAVFAVLASVAVFAAPAVGILGLPFLGGYLLSSAIGRIRSKRNGETKEDLARVRSGARARAARRAAAIYDRQRGWDMLAFPADMTVRPAGREASITCAGIPGLVHAEGMRDGTARFSFAVDGLERAQKARRRGASLDGADFSIQPDRRGGYIVSSSDPTVIGELAKAAFPLEQVAVRRTVEKVSQYLVSGCSTYEEALERFGRERGGMTPVNSFCRTVTEFEGQRLEDMEGSPLSGCAFEAGTFVIDAAESQVSEGRMDVQAGLAGRDLADTVMDRFDPLDEGVTTRQQPEALADGSRMAVDGEYVRRADGSSMKLSRDAAVLDDMGLSLYVVCSGTAEMAGVLADGHLPKDGYVLVGRDMPQVDGDSYVISVPLDSATFARLEGQGMLDEGLLERYSAAGVTEQAVRLSEMLDAVERDGYATMRTGEDISVLADGRVNGVAVQDVADRLGSTYLPALSGDRMQSWLDDAAKIDSVSITVDARKAELRVTSVVQGTAKTEIRPLTAKEMKDFAGRGALDRAEMKDFLMQSHPDFFRTYSGKPGFPDTPDPLGSLIQGRNVKRKAAQANGQGRKNGQGISI